MNELTGAVALAQTRKLDSVIDMLHRKKQLLKRKIKTNKDYVFRELNDENGECSTLITLIFNTKSKADEFAQNLGVKTLIHSGWHVYRNMNQVAEHKTPTEKWSQGAHYSLPGDLPRTEDILSRSVNISVGVVDNGLGSGYGVNLLSSKEEITSVAEKINTCLENKIER